MKKLFLILIAVATLFLFVGCSSSTTSSDTGDDELVGQWTSTEESETVEYQFNSDGTYTSKITTANNGTNTDVETEGTYKIDGTSLLLTQDSMEAQSETSGDETATDNTTNQEAAEYTFALDGDNLTITDANGQSQEFTKVS